MIQIRKYLQFIKEHELTQSQFLFLMFVHNKSSLGDVAGDYIGMFFGENGLPKSMIQDMIDKGWLRRIKENASRLSEYETTILLQKVIIDLYEDANEFWREYPSLIKSDNRMMPLTLMDVNEFRKLYAEIVHYSKDEHNEMILDLKYGVENGLINMKIENYLRSEFYLALRKLRNDVVENETTDRHDNF